MHIYITNPNVSSTSSSVKNYLNPNPFITILGDSNDNIQATNTTTIELQDTDLTDLDMDKIVDLSIVKGPDAMALRSEYTTWPGDKLVFKNLSVRSDNLYHCIICSTKPDNNKYYDFYIVLRYSISESEDIQIYTFGEKLLPSSIVADFEDETKTTYILTINLTNSTYWLYNFSILN